MRAGAYLDAVLAVDAIRRDGNGRGYVYDRCNIARDRGDGGVLDSGVAGNARGSNGGAEVSVIDRRDSSAHVAVI